MQNENFSIEIDGAEITDLYQDLISLEVELEDELAGMFRLTFSVAQQADGVWTNIDDERFRVWKEVIISAGFQDETEEIISGYITHVKPSFDADPNNVILIIWGMDKSVMLDREEKLKDWPSMKDSDIATTIFSDNGLTAEVEDTSVVHDEAVSTIIQRETDMSFLRRLALRNGYECYVQGDSGYFHTPKIDEEPQPVLAAHFGNETTLQQFMIEVNALTPTHVSMFQIDRTSKETLETIVESSEQTVLGDMDASSTQALGMSSARIYVSNNGATGNPEMEALCTGLYNASDWFVSAEGEVLSNTYGHVLKPRGTVTIKGIGETYSGVYYISHVTHKFTSDGYTQAIKVKRNAILPDGSENFASESDGLLGAVGL